MANVFIVEFLQILKMILVKLDYAKELSIEKEYIFNDHFTGKTLDHPELKRMIQFLRKGDIVFVESISRLGRSTGDIIKLIETWKEQRIHLVSKNEPIDTRTNNSMIEAMYVLFSKMELKQRKQ